MNPLKGLVILGFGGHARSVADVALASGIKTLLFIDEQAQEGENLLGFPVQKNFRGTLPAGWAYLSAAGDNQQRNIHIDLIESQEWPLTTLISPTATIGVGSRIESGTFIAHHAHIGPLVKIGKGCIINSGAIVDHESCIGQYSHVSVGTKIAGRTTVGDRCSIFAGATVIDSVNICDDVTVGGGAVVIRDIITPGIYVGVPAQRIKTPT